jgi:hypothetical protein
MSLLKVMPLAALGAVGYGGFQALDRNADLLSEVKVLATQNMEMRGIADTVAMEYTENEVLPLSNFSAFLVENLREAKGTGKRDRSRDLWDTPYELWTASGGFEIRSAGPDATWDTDDDLKLFYDLHGLADKPLPPAGLSSNPGRLSPRALAQANPPATAGPSSGLRPASSRPAQDQEALDRRILESQQRRAADGLPSSQFDLGLRYLTGNGVEQNPELAREWIEKAAEAGHRPAIIKLEELRGN